MRVTVIDSDGTALATRVRSLQPGGWLQLDEVFLRMAGRNDIVAGYARVEVVGGRGVIAYASVIDNATNDATAIAMKR